jgi:hypothetical protein
MANSQAGSLENASLDAGASDMQHHVCASVHRPAAKADILLAPTAACTGSRTHDLCNDISEFGTASAPRGSVFHTGETGLPEAVHKQSCTQYVTL